MPPVGRAVACADASGRASRRCSRSSASPRSGATRSCRCRTRSRSTRCSRSSPIRFAISTLVLAPFAWRLAAARSRGAGVVAGVGRRRAARGRLRPADRRARADDGLEHRLHHRAVRRADAAARARALPHARSRRPPGSGVALAVAGLLLLNGVPGGSAVGNALVLGNAVAQSFQIVAMERFAPRYDARALTFLQMAVVVRRLHRDRARARRALDAARAGRSGTRSSSRASSPARSATSSRPGCSRARPPRVRRSCSRSRRRSRRSSACCSSPSGSGWLGWAGCAVMLAGIVARRAGRGRRRCAGSPRRTEPA